MKLTGTDFFKNNRDSFHPVNYTGDVRALTEKSARKNDCPSLSSKMLPDWYMPCPPILWFYIEIIDNQIIEFTQ
jgi:hypothetical protein